MKFASGSTDKGELLAQFESEIENCTLCRLHEGRNKFVFGAGNPNADVMFIGEGPGREEDMKGEPFVGRAGQLLDKILAAIKFDRTIVYIGNIVKCRPPGNRDPQGDEMTTCMPYLYRQIEIIQPKLICCLGRISAQALLQTSKPLGKLRKEFHDFRGIKLMATYHPAALLRFQQYKRDTWEDVQMLRAEYDRMMGMA
jgi:DNA polymerase